MEDSWAEVFWRVWEAFEVEHGDEDSYTDYARVKRSVELRFGAVAGVAVSTTQRATDQEMEDERTKMEQIQEVV